MCIRDSYLHLRENGAGVGFATYNKVTGEPLESGQISEKNLPVSYTHLSLKADFILSLCELVVGGKEGLLPVEKTVIDRCVHLIYRKYFANPCPENMPCLLYTSRCV